MTFKKVNEEIGMSLRGGVLASMDEAVLEPGLHKLGVKVAV